MYKIFAKDKCIYLIDDKSLLSDKKGSKIVSFINKAQLLKEYEDFIQKEKLLELHFFSTDLELLWNEYRTLFMSINAAGGVVKNNKNELLLIFRQERWDLPKGKIEKGEDIKDAAIREVQEECGIREIEITAELPATHHTYLMNEKHIIKKTYWFEMRYSGSTEKLIPQLEESITEAKFMDADGVKEALKNTYPLIKEVLDSYASSVLRTPSPNGEGK